MDKPTWLLCTRQLCQTFLQNNQEGCKIQATLGSLLNSGHIGRSAFQSVYDLVTSWTCWSVSELEAPWETCVQFEVQSTHVEDGDPSSSYSIETDDQCVRVNCTTSKSALDTNLLLDVKSTPSKLELSKVTVNCVTVSTEIIKLTPSAKCCGVRVVRRKVFRLSTHFLWEYTFNLVWASPYVEDRDDPKKPLTFIQEPTCEVCVSCCANENTPPNTSVDYLAESLLYKIHDSIPTRYRSSDGTSVSLPSATV